MTKLSLPNEVSISVVLPVYNGSEYLAASIQSILNQSLSDLELVIVNDGSTDNSRAIIKSFLDRDHRVKYHEHNKNRGIAAAYNTGIKASTGRYVAFQEQDDISLPHRLEKQLMILSIYDVPFVTSIVGWINELGQVFKYWPDDMEDDVEIFQPGRELFARILKFQTIFPNASTMLDRHRLLPEDLIFDNSFRTSGQDWDFHLRLVSKYKTSRVKEPLLYMRRSEAHYSSTSNKPRTFHDNRRVLKKHLKVRPQHLFRDVLLLLETWSYEFLIEARHIRAPLGIVKGALSLLLWPLNKKAWLSLLKLTRLLPLK